MNWCVAECVFTITERDSHVSEKPAAQSWHSAISSEQGAETRSPMSNWMAQPLSWVSSNTAWKQAESGTE